MKQFALATILVATPVPVLPSRERRRDPVPVYAPGRAAVPPAPAVMGQLVSSETAEPLPDVLVSVDARDGDTDVTGEDGSFRVELPDTGRWRLELLGAGLGSATFEVELFRAETAVRLLEVRVGPDAGPAVRWVREPRQVSGAGLADGADTARRDHR